MQVMALTEEEVKKIALLCRIRLSEDEVRKYQKELSQVLDYVSELQKVDTEGVEEISQVTELVNVFRPDVVQKSEITEEIIALFPESQNRLLKIKSIL
jgi:aspartyl-tRNA(Asn)/glutamyl-tRNA(Gln) amidotransferase subunit C